MARIICKFGPFYPWQTESVKVWGNPVLFAQQGGALFVWAECERERNPSSYDEYQIIPTGEDLKDRRHYFSLVDSGGYVWHLVR